MIMCNVEDTLDVCLSSIKGLFDKLVIVDTGSTDRSVEIARSYGAVVVHDPWRDDFSHARNIAWDLLDTEWRYWLDCDDLLLGRERFDEMVSKCIEMKLDGVILEYLYALDAVGQKRLAELEPHILAQRVNSSVVTDELRKRCITTQFRERLVRNDPTWRWHYPVHEALPAAGRRLGKFDGVTIVHRRHVRKNPVSSGRNMRILQTVPEHLRDERIWFYFGLEYATAHQYVESAQAFERYLPLSTVEDERYLALHFLGDLYRQLGDLDRSQACDLKAVALRPTWRDAYAGLLQTSVVKQDWERALYYGAMCQRAEIPETPFAFNPLHEAVGWVGDYVTTLLRFGLFGEAHTEVQRYLSLVPEDTTMQTNLDAITAEMNVQTGGESLASALEFLLRQDDAETAALLIARLSSRLQQHPEIKRWTSVVSAVCGPASRGQIPVDQIKYPPHMAWLSDCGHQHEDELWLDPRIRYMDLVLAKRPYTRRILQVGGPTETAALYNRIGVDPIRLENLDAFDQITESFDLTVLWSCLERVKYPDRVVEACRKITSPGGDLLAFVPNGPATRGLADPDKVSPRLRAFSGDALRQILGTVRMPEVLEGWSANAGDLALLVPLPLPVGRPKTIAIVCPFSPEPWGPDSLRTGIGGSEEAVVRLSRAFAKRGHAVTVYGAGWVGEDVVQTDASKQRLVIQYEPMARYRRSDVVIGWRYPDIFVNQMRPFEGEWRALWLHDSVDKQRVAVVAPFLDVVWCISDYHASLYQGLPNIYRGRNGIDPFELPEIGSVERNPAKLVYVSTPFRGLDVLLESYWPEIKRRVPEAEIHAYYGWDSADRMGVTATPEGKAFKEKVMNLCTQPGVVWRGRIGQQELYKEVSSAGAWVYPSNWREENCISSYIAQACGAWPVVSPLGALHQSVVFGWKVEDPNLFVKSVVDAIQTEGRERMMEWARQHLSWNDVAAMWERLWRGYPA